jgi:TM2 domain-containing membrane protein YozV
VNTLDETQYEAGTVVKYYCLRCEEEILVSIPEHQKKQIEVVSAPPKKAASAPAEEEEDFYMDAAEVEEVAPPAPVVVPVSQPEEEYYEAEEVEEVSPVPVVNPAPQTSSVWTAQPREPANSQPSVQQVYTSDNRKSKSTATILCFFLGGFGVHCFYLGKYGVGILRLILTIWLIGLGFVSFGVTFFILGIAVLIEWLQLLCMSQRDFDKKYNAS